MLTPAAAGLAVSLSVAHKQGRALSLVAMGIPLSQVIGLPLTALVGGLYGWRVAFAGIAVLLVLIALLIAIWVPATPRPSPLTLGDFKVAVFDAGLLRTTLLTLLMSAGCTTIYTFQLQIFIEQANLSGAQIGTAFLCLGMGTFYGTWLAGFLIDRIGAVATMTSQGVLSSLVVLAMTLHSYDFVAACVLAILAGISLFNFIPAIQVRLLKLMPDSPVMLFSINSSFLYLGTAVGGFVSGSVVNSVGIWALGPAAAAFVIAAMLQLAFLRRNVESI